MITIDFITELFCRVSLNYLHTSLRVECTDTVCWNRLPTQTRLSPSRNGAFVSATG